MARAANAVRLQFRLPMKAGPQTIGVAFIKRTRQRSMTFFSDSTRAGTNDLNLGYQHGFTTVPHVASVEITGPFNATGPGDTPSRRTDFVCRRLPRPTEEMPCARKILSTLARRAYRRPVTDEDVRTIC